ncbi:AAA family ATPase [Berryella wangjianweii]|uniref:nitrogenase n=1 Tax=Berryella wangjianweii TaxID=2734634 RepID=A0A6M8J371_9ACTN|nr:nitrogenase iron protein NifH [Berryella wangjianweii]QKF07073.1 AAA family ATPase [Berryella wangjianweii]
MRRIAIYGKGGIGKSTTTSNLSAALVSRGYAVMQIGCDPKADSTRLHTGGKRIPTVLDQLRANQDLALEDLVKQSESGVYCVESGGPLPGVGCAGRGVITAFEQLDELGAYEIIRPDFVLYDVLGDVVCGGFAMPLRGGYAQQVLVVTSGEMMSLYAASNIMTALKNFKSRNYAQFAGLVVNRRDVADEEAIIRRFCEEEQANVVGDIPRSPEVQICDEQGKLCARRFPKSPASLAYQRLADYVESLPEAK